MARTLFLIFLGLFNALQVSSQLNVDFSANITGICSGHSVIFTNNTSGATSAASYSWSFGTGASPSTATGEGPITVIYSGSGTSTVSLTVKDIVTRTKTKSNYITVNPSPVANPGTGGNICGLNFTLSAVLTPGGGTGTWTKISGPGNVLFTPDAHHPDAKVKADTPGTYQFAWTVVNLTCQSASQVNVTFYGSPDVSVSRDTAVCKGKSVTIHAQGTGIFHWSPENTVSNYNVPDPVVSPLSPTYYKVTVTDQRGCASTDSIFVDVLTVPVANAGNDLILEYLFTTPVTASEPDPHSRGVWSVIYGTGTFDDTASAATVVSGLSTGKNVLLWTVSNGICQSSHALLTIIVNDLVIPTLITPNMDGLNDNFVLRGIETLGKTELVIFNRWGGRVYINKNYANEWNGVDSHGDPLPDDTYFFTLKAENGISKSGFIVIRR